MSAAEPEAIAWEDPRRVLRRHGLTPKKRFSQNFLVSRHAVERIVRALAPRRGETVVELGPGLGTLTGALLSAGASVVAVERDRDMLAVLEQEHGAHAGLTLVEGDAAKVDLSAHAPLALAGNLPYAITGAILSNLTRHRSAVRCAVLMMQREVALRLRAEPGTKTYGVLSVFTQAAFTIDPVMSVPPGAFHPPPKVHSAIVCLTPRPAPLAEETPMFRSVVKSAFGQRRKTLRNSLSGLVTAETLETLDIDPKRRAETLTIEDFARIAERAVTDR